jgi:DNA-binding transcriptional MerR regulator
MNITIGDLAERAGYAVQTVRYYEQIGLMPKPPRTGGNQRRYGEAELRRLLFIRHARDLGFEIDDVRSLLELAAHPERPCASADAIAKQHLAAIDAKIAQLKALRAELTTIVDSCASGSIAQCGVIDALAHCERHGETDSHQPQ